MIWLMNGLMKPLQWALLTQFHQSPNLILQHPMESIATKLGVENLNERQFEDSREKIDGSNAVFYQVVGLDRPGKSTPLMIDGDPLRVGNFEPEGLGDYSFPESGIAETREILAENSLDILREFDTSMREDNEELPRNTDLRSLDATAIYMAGNEHDKGFTRDKVSEATGVSKSTISRWRKKIEKKLTS